MVMLPHECSRAPRASPGAPQEPWFHPVPKSAHHPTVPCTSSRARMLLAAAGHPGSFQTPLPAPGTAPCSASGQAPIFTTLLSQVCRLLNLAELARRTGCRAVAICVSSPPKEPRKPAVFSTPTYYPFPLGRQLSNGQNTFSLVTLQHHFSPHPCFAKIEGLL